MAGKMNKSSVAEPVISEASLPMLFVKPRPLALTVVQKTDCIAQNNIIIVFL